MRSIFPERWNVPRSRPRWSSGAERSEPNETSKRRGTSGSSRLGLGADERLRSRQSALAQLAALEVGQLEPRLAPRL